MPTIQEMADIAILYETAPSDAMIVACVQRHYETGEPLQLHQRPPTPAPREGRPAESVPWRRYVERNTDTRDNHV